MNSIVYNGRTYEDENLKDLDCYIGDSLASDELAVDTLTAVVQDFSNQPRILAANGLPLMAGGRLLIAKTSHVQLDAVGHYGDVVRHYRKGEQFGKFYLESIKRTGKYEYTLNCLSAIGLLLTSDHYGGIYTGESAAEVMKDIVGGIISYTLSEELATVPVYGLLRKQKRRDNLRDLLFAIGGQIRKDTLGELNIIPMTAGEPYEISADEFYMGGSVTGGNPATSVNVTEHSFMALDSDDVVTLFDGAAAGDEIVTPKGKTVIGVLVDFREPMHDLEIQNSTILEQGANYAVISNSAAAILTGKQYTHTTRIVSRKGNSSGVPNVLSSSACELVNLMNSELVADRLMAYYGNAKTIEADIVVTNQKPGDAVTFEDPFGDATTGFIVDMELIVSTILKAKATLVSGYVPTASGNYYSHMLIISTSQTVTIPAEAKDKGLLVLISGGEGGHLGEYGKAGEYGSGGRQGQTGKGGEGGAPGTPGAGGKIFVRTIPIKAGQTFAVTIGKGGSAQTSTAAAGVGGATKFGSYTSEDGFSSVDGYINIINGEIYAIPGEEGLPGGRGSGADSEGENITYEGATYTPGAKAADVSLEGKTAGGGYGGGPAIGSNGAGGSEGRCREQSNGSIWVSGGSGGIGATPVKARDGEKPGQGGSAGHGGGGGGGGGFANGAYDYSEPGPGGSGGAPGVPGNGADGLAVLYY